MLEDHNLPPVAAYGELRPGQVLPLPERSGSPSLRNAHTSRTEESCWVMRAAVSAPERSDPTDDAHSRLARRRHDLHRSFDNAAMEVWWDNHSWYYVPDAARYHGCAVSMRRQLCRRFMSRFKRRRARFAWRISMLGQGGRCCCCTGCSATTWTGRR